MPYNVMQYVRCEFSKKTILFGNFTQMAVPPPPFGNFSHFLPIFFGQVRNFWVILRRVKGFLGLVFTNDTFWELGWPPPPPPFREKFLNIPFFRCASISCFQVSKGRGQKRGKSLVFYQTSLAPPPGLVFSEKKIDPHFFCWKMHL